MAINIPVPNTGDFRKLKQLKYLLNLSKDFAVKLTV